MERLPDSEALENAGLRFLDLSLDGKAMLCLQIGETMAEGTSGYHLSLILGKEILPVTVNAGHGDGDLYGKAEMIRELLQDLPGSEGISWPADRLRRSCILRPAVDHISWIAMDAQKSISCTLWKRNRFSGMQADVSSWYGIMGLIPYRAGTEHRR